ncbi:MAG: hypothetical protein LAP85_02770 [Acidobacteriia bacterium]|nr:hypothetical protein [Terriglobia bacterium]
MAEFTSEFKRDRRPVTLLITIAVAAVALAAVFFIVRYQKNNPPPKEAGVPVAVPGMAHPGDPDFEAYKDRVHIENVKASIGIPMAGPRFALIDGIIANEGSRKLEALEMRVTLYDVYDKLSKEVIRTPLRPGVGLDNRPMEPLEKRTFHFGVESVEQLWNPKRVEIQITGLKYK